MIEGILISSAPVQYQACMKKADDKGNRNKKVDSADEAVLTADCYYSNGENALKDQERLAKLLVGANLYLDELTKKTADAEVDKQLGRLTSENEFVRKKALQTLSFLSASGVVSLQAKEKMVGPVIRTFGFGGYASRLAEVQICLNLVRSELAPAVKGKLLGLILGAVEENGDILKYVVAGYCAHEIIKSADTPRELRIILAASLIDSLKFMSNARDIVVGLANVKFKHVSKSGIESEPVPGKADKESMSGPDLEAIVVSPLLRRLQEKNISFDVIHVLTMIVVSRNLPDEKTREIADLLTEAIVDTCLGKKACEPKSEATNLRYYLNCLKELQKAPVSAVNKRKIDQAIERTQ
jgi:hypothetical protein